MTRTQIYLTSSEAEGVARVAAESGRKQSAVIREAIDLYLQSLGSQDCLSRLREGQGIWSDHEGIDLTKLRGEFERF